jgi:hypothetical protein
VVVSERTAGIPPGAPQSPMTAKRRLQTSDGPDTYSIAIPSQLPNLREQVNEICSRPYTYGSISIQEGQRYNASKVLKTNIRA